MNTLNSYNFTTSPLPQPTQKLRRLENPTLRSIRLSEVYNRRNLNKKRTGISEVKELDAETGLYYYGARYLDPRTSRWLSGDPAIYEGDYLPSAPINDEARKRNQNLPGIGGIYNIINLHAYHYSFNNPILYFDPDGRNGNQYLNRLRNVGNSISDFVRNTYVGSAITVTAEYLDNINFTRASQVANKIGNTASIFSITTSFLSLRAAINNPNSTDTELFTAYYDFITSAVGALGVKGAIGAVCLEAIKEASMFLSELSVTFNESLRILYDEMAEDYFLNDGFVILSDYDWPF